MPWSQCRNRVKTVRKINKCTSRWLPDTTRKEKRWMKTISYHRSNTPDNEENIRILRDWISEFTTLKMRFEPHRRRITTEHVEVIFIKRGFKKKC